EAIHAIRDYAAAVKAQGIVSCDEPRLLWLARHREQLEVKLLAPSAETLSFLYSKRRQIQLAVKVGFHLLPTVDVCSHADVSRIPASLYPVIIRPDDKWKLMLPFKLELARSAAEMHTFV